MTYCKSSKVFVSHKSQILLPNVDILWMYGYFATMQQEFF